MPVIGSDGTPLRRAIKSACISAKLNPPPASRTGFSPLACPSGALQYLPGLEGSPAEQDEGDESDQQARQDQAESKGGDDPHLVIGTRRGQIFPGPPCLPEEEGDEQD